MFGNGAATGTATIVEAHRPTRRGLLLAPSACCVAVAGAATRGVAECRTGTATTPVAGAAMVGSASVVLSKLFEKP